MLFYVIISGRPGYICLSVNEACFVFVFCMTFSCKFLVNISVVVTSFFISFINQYALKTYTDKIQYWLPFLYNASNGVKLCEYV